MGIWNDISLSFYKYHAGMPLGRRCCIESINTCPNALLKFVWLALSSDLLFGLSNQIINLFHCWFRNMWHKDERLWFRKTSCIHNRRLHSLWCGNIVTTRTPCWVVFSCGSTTTNRVLRHRTAHLVGK